ncbi:MULTISPECIES: tetratricopeptide repeat protein [Streptosporangium]|uniref:Tetratricopeptide (TPR) repeat protein n=1 Tax=Streptosporangium brasiliense TaxID=47480 RepID=A0ABT9QY95_9ACTN|nr:tetratricopeptide repeat protein [Streptosporangium brasiliense]MDP9861499.1 tetratricopeptide (TPR) repeat protein [Streptosporangium brasiliense]
MRETSMNPAEDGVHAGRADGGWETDYEQLAGLNHLLGLQREEGDREAALGTARRALERARRLPPLHRLAVAEALQELREELTASELWDEARQVAVETVRAYAGLGQDGLDLRFRHALALDGMAGIDLRLGEPASALEAVLTSTGMYRALAGADPAGYRPELLRSLHNLRHVHRELGRLGDAAGAMRQAVALCREARDGDSGWTPELARALDRLGWDLEESGQHGAAVSALEESAALYGECPGSEESRADVQERLGVVLTAMGRSAEAVEAAAAATALLREIGDPARLATALHNLGISLRGAGRAAEAAEAVRESVELLQRLYDADPGWAAGLAATLGFLSLLREECGQFEQAATSGERAVSLLERLRSDGDGDGDHGHDLAQALHNLGRHHERLGRPDRAAACLERALTLYGELAWRAPDRSRSGLADAWVAQSVYLALLGRPEEAVAAAQLAADLYGGASPAETDHLATAAGHPAGTAGRQAGTAEHLATAVEHPAGTAGRRAGMAEALSHLGARAADAGHHGRAVRATARAVDLYEDLASLDPGSYLDKLADELDSLAVRHCDQEDHEKALPLLERAASIWDDLGHGAKLAVTLRRQLLVLSCLRRDTETVTDRLLAAADDPVDAFTALGEQLVGARQPEAALEHLIRAVTLWEIMSMRQPDASASPCARALCLMATCLDDLLRPDEAVVVQAKAVDLLTAAVENEPEQLPLLSWALGELAGYLRQAGRAGEALDHRRRAVEIDRGLAIREPALHRRSFAGSLTELGQLLEDLGSHAEAEEVLTRARLLSATLPDAGQVP